MACYVVEAEAIFWDLSRLFLKVRPHPWGRTKWLGDIRWSQIENEGIWIENKDVSRNWKWWGVLENNLRQRGRNDGISGLLQKPKV